MEGRIAEDGEFLVRGPLVMKGYRKEPKKTAEAVDDDGWLHTGDVMEVDEDGYLKIVDRKKELIINAAGRTCRPPTSRTPSRRRARSIGVMLVVGDARPYNTALIVLDAESAGPYAAQRGLADDLAGDARRPPGPDLRDRGGRRRRQREIVEGGADQAFPGAADLLGARRRRDHPDDEAQAQADPREVHRRDRRALRPRHRRRGPRAEGAASAAQ